MKVHRRFSIFGSRLLFFALAPWLLVCIPLFPYMAFNFAKDGRAVLLAGLLSAVCLVGLLVAIDSWRFIRLNIALLLGVPIAYVLYFCLTYYGEGQTLAGSRLSAANPFSALVGLFFWGVPATLGALRLNQEAKRIRAIEEKRRRSARGC